MIHFTNLYFMSKGTSIEYGMKIKIRSVTVQPA
jgi:hypothetical protein